MNAHSDIKKAMALKIKALLAKTTEAGCSESEALAAMHKAHELLAKYQIDLSELDLREEGTSEAEVQMSEISKDLSGEVGRYCEVKSWRNLQTKKHHFLGLQSDVFFAEWLLLALTGFVQRKTLDFSLSSPRGVFQNEVAEFQIGCCQRIRQRLREDREARSASPTSGANALMVIKNQLVTEAWAKKNLTLDNRGSYYRKGVASEAWAKGFASGNDARFSRPVARDEFGQRALQAPAGAKK